MGLTEIIRVSEDIYTSAGGVVLELIQNADDASYERSKFAPGITFYLHHDKIVVECNEDGFTYENVDSICQVGNSNKGEDSIGEKGLGFKSVFMIASKVHIESRGYSFSFSFKKGEKEWQKVTPMYEESDNPPDGVTRITLFLIDSQLQRCEAHQKFKNVPPTMLLFLKKLKKLTIINNLNDGTPTSTTYAIQTESTQRQVLNTSIVHADGHVCTTPKHFHLVRRTAYNLPTAENRKNPHAEIILAFPLSPNDVPLIEKQQDIFAHLPIGETGVGFSVS